MSYAFEIVHRQVADPTVQINQVLSTEEATTGALAIQMADLAPLPAPPTGYVRSVRLFGFIGDTNAIDNFWDAVYPLLNNSAIFSQLVQNTRPLKTIEEFRELAG